jgi:hypothetical protein
MAAAAVVKRARSQKAKSDGPAASGLFKRTRTHPRRTAFRRVRDELEGNTAATVAAATNCKKARRLIPRFIATLPPFQSDGPVFYHPLFFKQELSKKILVLGRYIVPHCRRCGRRAERGKLPTYAVSAPIITTHGKNLGACQAAALRLRENPLAARAIVELL